MREIQARGVEALERVWPGLKEKYRRSHRSPLRLAHAVDFALHGGPDGDGLRAVLLEAPSHQRERRKLEKRLINQFNEANGARKLPKLLTGG